MKTHSFTITVKFLCLFLLIILPVILILAYESYRIACENVNRKTEEYISDILFSTGNNIETTLKDIDNVLFSIKNDDTIQTGLKKLSTGNLSQSERYNWEFNITKTLYSYTMYDNQIRSVAVVDQHGNDIGINKNAYWERIHSTIDMEPVDQKNGATYWLFSVGSGNLTLASQVNNLITQRPIGHIIMTVDEKQIQSIYSSISFAGQSDITLIRSDGLILSHKDPAMLNQYWGQEEGIFSLVNGKSFFSIEDLYDGRFYVAGYYLERCDMYLIIKVPVDINQQELSIIANSIGKICVLILVLSIFIYFFAAKKLFKPAKELSEAIRLFGQGELDSRFEVKSKDEIGIIAENFNEMAANINELIDQVYQEQIFKQQAELKSLQMQINPHFLYNVLETINWMSRIKGIPEIGVVSKALGDLMRATIDGDDYIPVSQELQNIRNYLYIQSFRYGDRLNIWISIDDDILSYLVPKLILQPLIENSIVHGFEEKLGQGNIMIKGALENHTILFEIADDGSGMSEEKRQRLLNPIDPNTGKRTSIGVRNVISRLKLYYGEKCQFEVESTPGEGTTIRIRIPTDFTQKN